MRDILRTKSGDLNMDTDKRLFDENGRVLPYLKPIAEHRLYSLKDIAKGVYYNIREHYPAMQIKITESPKGFFIQLVEDGKIF